MDELIVKSVVVLIVLGVATLAWNGMRRAFTIEAWQQGLRYRDGAFAEVLAPGRHVYFDPRGRNRVAVLPRHPLAGNAGAIDVSSKDGFAYRVTLGYSWRITDPRRYQEESGTTAASIDYGVALAGFTDRLTAMVMAQAAALPLEEVQAAPQRLANDLAATLNTAYPSIDIEQVTLTRIALPPEVRKLLTEVERARREGLAALERARGEGAALRSLANAARLVRDNPELGQLRLLQAIESAKRPPTVVLGQTPSLPGIAPAGD